MLGYIKIRRLPSIVETILIISCWTLLTKGLPLMVQDGEQEIRMDVLSTIDCKLNQNKNSTFCALVNIAILQLSHQHQ